MKTVLCSSRISRKISRNLPGITKSNPAVMYQLVLQKYGFFPDSYTDLNNLKKSDLLLLHLGLVEGDVCPCRCFNFLTFRVREEPLRFFIFVGFFVRILQFFCFLFGMDTKETVYRVFTALAEIILLVLAFAAFRNMGREDMGKMDPPEIGIDLPVINEFFYVPWRILHGRTYYLTGILSVSQNPAIRILKIPVIIISITLPIRGIKFSSMFRSVFFSAIVLESFADQRKD